jgi:hypothetical protein
VTLIDVDLDFPAASGYNSLLVYTNITLTALPWQNPPDIEGPAVELAGLNGHLLGGNEYPGLQFGNGYIYASCQRNNGSDPNLQIYTYDPAVGFTHVGRCAQGRMLFNWAMALPSILASAWTVSTWRWKPSTTMSPSVH